MRGGLDRLKVQGKNGGMTAIRARRGPIRPLNGLSSRQEETGKKPLKVIEGTIDGLTIQNLSFLCFFMTNFSCKWLNCSFAGHFLLRSYVPPLQTFLHAYF